MSKKWRVQFSVENIVRNRTWTSTPPTTFLSYISFNCSYKHHVHSTLRSEKGLFVLQIIKDIKAGTQYRKLERRNEAEDLTAMSTGLLTTP